ncbi:glycosyltransferase family 4 protein [Priestia abyssalis]|uniref:glycosyltransferase family 4 protein n=1 Tax=Priestia abyssalis TaxID=1221450 RepID=UPI000995D1FE|nr:glycosyltransferase family 4 protein [Priestia abyssalis]
MSSIVDYFLERVGKENLYYCYITDESVTESIDKISNIHQFRNIGLFQKMFNLTFYTLLLKKKSIQEALLYNKDLRKEINRIVERNNIDIIVYDTLRIAQMFENDDTYKNKEFIYLDDLFSVRYQKMIDVLKKYPTVNLNPLGNFYKYVPKSLRRLVKLRSLTRILLETEKGLIYKREIQSTRNFRHNLLISSKEVNILKKRAGCSNIREIRPYIDFNTTYDRNYNGEPIFIFLGLLNIPHNDFSICEFIEKNIIEIIHQIPNFKLKIIGKNPSERLKKLCMDYGEHIELCGYVENLEQVFKDACAMLIPLQFGTGVKLKTLEAFSRGLPVISTSYGVEGISIDNKHIILEENILKYPSHMKNLVDIEVNNKYSLSIYNFYKNEYSKDKIYKMYDEIFHF